MLPKVAKKKAKKRGGSNESDEIIYRLNVLLEAFKKPQPDQTIMEGTTIIKALNIVSIDDLMKLNIADLFYHDQINQSLEGNRNTISRCIRKLRDDINEEKEVVNNILKNTFRDIDLNNLISMIEKLGLKKINDIIFVKTDDVKFLSDANKEVFHKLQENLKKRFRIYILLIEAGFFDYEAIKICEKLELINENRRQNVANLISVSKNIIDKIGVLSFDKKELLWRWIISYIFDTELATQTQMYDDDTKKNIINEVIEYLNKNAKLPVSTVYNLFSNWALNMEIMLEIQNAKAIKGENISDKKVAKEVVENADKVIKLLNPDNVLQFINYNVDRIYSLKTDMNTIIQILVLRDALETKYIDILYIIAKAKSDHSEFLLLVNYIKPLFSAIFSKRIIHRLQLKSVEDLISTHDDVILKIFPYDERNMKGLPRNKNIIETQIKRLQKLRDELKESRKTRMLSSSKRSSSSSSKKSSTDIDELLKYLEKHMMSS